MNTDHMNDVISADQESGSSNSSENKSGDRNANNVAKNSSERKVRKQEIDSKGRAHGVGKRKSSVAKVWIKPGSNKIMVNGMECDKYFDGRQYYVQHLSRPMSLCGDMQFDVDALVHGGGKTGNAGAIRLGISNALVKLNPEFYDELRSNGLMTYDTRKVLRKKAGFVKHSKRKPTSRR